MARTLRFGTHSTPRLSSRIDRFVIRRRTTVGYTAAQQAADDYSLQVAIECSPGQKSYPRATRVAVHDDLGDLVRRRMDFLAG